jgi:polysaccharide deacetylase 2 family uncharacterized protein YibQ
MKRNIVLVVALCLMVMSISVNATSDQVFKKMDLVVVEGQGLVSTGTTNFPAINPTVAVVIVAVAEDAGSLLVVTSRTQEATITEKPMDSKEVAATQRIIKPISVNSGRGFYVTLPAVPGGHQVLNCPLTSAVNVNTLAS